MSKLYDMRFKIGAGVWVLGWVIGNLASYIGSQRSRVPGSISFSPVGDPAWGFPWNWDGGLWSILNMALILLGALFFGLIFRWLIGLVK